MQPPLSRSVVPSAGSPEPRASPSARPPPAWAPPCGAPCVRAAPGASGASASRVHAEGPGTSASVVSSSGPLWFGHREPLSWSLQRCRGSPWPRTREPTVTASCPELSLSPDARTRCAPRAAPHVAAVRPGRSRCCAFRWAGTWPRRAAFAWVTRAVCPAPGAPRAATRVNEYACRGRFCTKSLPRGQSCPVFDLFL